MSFFFCSSTYSIDDLGEKVSLFTVERIEVRGLKKVEKEAVLEKISIKKGMRLDNYLLRKSLTQIYRMKYFDSVEAHRKRVKGKNSLIFIVKEKPIISEILFEGSDEVGEDDLKEVLKSKEFSILDINTVKADVKALTKLYEEKGFYLANVEHEIRKAQGENIKIVFKINEFDKVRVKKITFLGNKAFQDKELKDIMETREEGLFSFMSNSGNFKEFNFQTDIERIKYFYNTKGYLQANVGSPEVTVSEDKKWVFITIKVTEGPQFTVNKISYQGELLFTEPELVEKTRLKENETYSEAVLRKDIQVLTELYQDKGYAFANVLRTLKIVPGENKVDVEFSFEKGKIAYFGKVTVKGNTKTRDKVVRRELLIVEGKKYSGSSMRRSKENVNRLGFFEPGSVIFNTVTSKERDDVLDVEITVKERNTGQLSLGAGYSTATGEFLQASISQNNFRGLGQVLKFSLSWSSKQKNVSLGFTEPYLFDTKWTGGGEVSLSNNERSNGFQYERKAFNLRVGYPIFDYTRIFLTYKLEDTTITGTTDPTIDLNVENGIASAVRKSIVRDTRNNRFEPSKGYYTSYAIEYAGVGGDKKWLKNEVDLRYFHSVVGDLVFRSRLYGAKLERVNGQAIPRTEKLTLGGSRNLRGYNFEAVGPLVTTEDTNGFTRTFNTGGLFASFTSLELEHPLAREAGLKWVLFFDAGHAGDYNDIKLYKDYGFGFRWFSPIGVLRFEFGYPIGEEGKDAGSQFHFDIGQLF
ncbi:MAG: outer membrane protein assembly factor BamA [Bacteriovoracaceae bacterium]